MEQRTTRQEIERTLELSNSGLTPSGLASRLEEGPTESEVLEHLKHILESRDIMVIPPECRNCGFNSYDTYLNIPSGCPECGADSYNVKPPAFKITE